MSGMDSASSEFLKKWSDFTSSLWSKPAIAIYVEMAKFVNSDHGPGKNNFYLVLSSERPYGNIMKERGFIRRKFRDVFGDAHLGIIYDKSHADPKKPYR